VTPSFGSYIGGCFAVVGIVAAKVGEKVLKWLSSIWMVRVQILTSLLIVGMGVVLTIRAVSELAALR